jgi:PTS system nitrogen regulatory IIA component
MPTETSDYWKLFKAKSCSVGLKANDRDGVFDELVENLVHGGSLEEALRGAALKALVAREEMASTGVGMNVAIPHVKLAGLDRVAVSLSIHLGGVDWNATDGDPVNLFFTVLRPDRPGEQHDPDRHLEMMRWIARLARDSDFRRFAMAAKSKKELVDLLKEKAEL